MPAHTGFERAFDSVADVVERAAALPDHRERPVQTPVVSLSSDAGEVEVTVQDGQVRSMRLESFWLTGTPADEVADLITATTNKAMEEWSRQQLEQLQEITPDMKQLHVAISAARQQLQDAWVATLAEVKTP